jgi:predicted ArsR family transcriptional regulator
MSEFLDLWKGLSEEERMSKLRKVEISKPYLRKLVTSGYSKIINYLVKVGDSGSYILEIANNLEMNPGDVRHKLHGLKEMGIVKLLEEKPASHPKGGGRPKQIYCINYENYDWRDLAKILESKEKYETITSDELIKVLEKTLKSKIVIKS